MESRSIQANKNKKQSFVASAGDKLLTIDRLSSQFNMTFDGGKTSLSTWTGTALSLFLFVVIIVYGVQKVQALVLNTNSNIAIAK